MDPHFHAHPSAQRDCPATHTSNCRGSRGEYLELSLLDGEVAYIQIMRVIAGMFRSRTLAGAARRRRPALQRPPAGNAIQCACAPHRRCTLSRSVCRIGRCWDRGPEPGRREVVFVERAAPALKVCAATWTAGLTEGAQVEPGSVAAFLARSGLEPGFRPGVSRSAL